MRTACGAAARPMAKASGLETAMPARRARATKSEARQGSGSGSHRCGLSGGTEPGSPANSSRQHRIPGRRDGRVCAEELGEEPGSVSPYPVAVDARGDQALQMTARVRQRRRAGRASEGAARVPERQGELLGRAPRDPGQVHARVAHVYLGATEC